MQERYLGDIHDFYKFLFIKHLASNLKVRIGLNWFLVDPKSISKSELKKNDGEKRSYLNNPKVTNLDEKLSSELSDLVKKKNRNLKNFTTKTHLQKFVKFYNEKIMRNERKLWFENSINFFCKNEIIFLDPDNGILKRPNGRNSQKYVLLDELKSYQSKEKIIIFTQFQSYNKSFFPYISEITNFLKSNGLKIKYPVLRNRTSPNTFYITIGQDRVINNQRILSVYKSYKKKFEGTIELITI